MAKLTGQFTTPSLDAQNNKTHKPFLHGVVFVFTGATKVTRETDAKGKYSFDLANGEYEVSVYLKGNTEKDRFDMRAGEKFTVTATTQADALEKWLQVIGTSGKDELATYYENLLAQMQKMHADTKAVRDEMVGNSVGAGHWIREGAGGFLAKNIGVKTFTEDDWKNLRSGESYFLGTGSVGIPVKTWYFLTVLGVRNIGDRSSVILTDYTGAKSYMGYVTDGGQVSFEEIYTSRSTVTDSNGIIHRGSTVGKQSMVAGDFGLGAVTAPLTNFKEVNGLHRSQNGQAGVEGLPSLAMNFNILSIGYMRNRASALVLSPVNNNAYVWNAGTDSYAALLNSENTTVDSNGFIKAASPIIKLFNDRIEHSGFGDNQPIFEKLSTGTYKISNTLGLAQEGWTYEKPRGNDGQPYFRIEVEKLEDGCIVRVHDEYDTVEKAEITDIDGNTRTVDKIVKILGQARDIKEHERWIDLRFHEEPEEHQDEVEVDE